MEEIKDKAVEDDRIGVESTPPDDDFGRWLAKKIRGIDITTEKICTECHLG